MVVVAVTPPPVPVMVMVCFPVGTVLAILIVSFEVPDPGAAIVLGLKVAPVAFSATAESKLPVMAEVMVEVPELPCATVMDEGLAESEKLPT